ncbi:uncharacterized protein C10orf95 homolog [Lethenteron reissneri]|uniref:uncharacterized protein C10orf95 homolog n=1 Tax=Lethenteron reissneri TaxID=7753 RepID=UPI002AB7D4E6|nr:uncharacterized protein C10orf95 homolog [Lethenteron reissneri]
MFLAGPAPILTPPPVQGHNFLSRPLFFPGAAWSDPSAMETFHHFHHGGRGTTTTTSPYSSYSSSTPPHYPYQHAYPYLHPGAYFAPYVNPYAYHQHAAGYYAGYPGTFGLYYNQQQQQQHHQQQHHHQQHHHQHQHQAQDLQHWPEGARLSGELRFGEVSRVHAGSERRPLPALVLADLRRVYGTFPHTAFSVSRSGGEFLVHGEPRVGPQEYTVERRVLRPSPSPSGSSSGDSDGGRRGKGKGKKGARR